MEEEIKIPTNILIFATATCFFCHGYFAIANSAVYYSEWSAWVQSLLPEVVQYQGSNYFLKVIGTIDIIAAIGLVVARKKRFFLGWTLIWGAMTTVSRLYFLSSFNADFLYNIQGALAGFLLRFPNWVLPLIIIRRLYPEVLPRFLMCLKEFTLIEICVATQMLGLIFHQGQELVNPMFIQELEKFGMPLWFFNLIFFGAGLFFVFYFFAWFKDSRKSLAYASFLALFGFSLTEIFNVFFQIFPHGFVFTVLNIGEHMPIYLVLSYFFLAAKRCKNSSLKSAN